MRSNTFSASAGANFRSSVARHVLAASLAASILPGIALAQAASEDQQDASTNSPEIVVTGTLLRNVAPAGAQSIAISQQTIQATGATSTDQMLATVPQLSTFGTLQKVNAGGTQLTVNQINLRNLPQGVGGSSPTLVLVDGHRIVSAGVKQAYPDPDVIPPALIQRVDVLTDGGSAIYGSDAVGGVVNFITKDRYDGFDINGRHSFGDDYKATDINFTAGKDWDSGSVFVSYNLAKHDAVYGRDRSYIRNINYTTGLPIDLGCTPPNVTQSGVTYAVSGRTLTAGTANLCDRAKDKYLYPRETRHSVMAGFRQELSDSIEFELKGFYSRRETIGDNGPLVGTASVTSSNPNYISTGNGSTATQSVNFNFAPVGGREVVNTTLWSFGITPSLRWKFGHDWQMFAYYNYGKSQTVADDPVVNSTALASNVTSGLINPYNIAASNSGAIAQVLDYTNRGIGRDTLSNAKVTFDGPLFSLPGGDMRVAVGGEYIHEKYAGYVKTDTYQNHAITVPTPADRDVASLFAELNLPLIGPDNNIPLIHSLTVAAAGRYDHYSDFGSNWAPNIGATWKPIEWISVRGRWNKSFQAPSLVQLSQSAAPFVTTSLGSIINAVPLLRNPAVAPNGGPLVALNGAAANLEPQRARGYNLGADISPPIIPGLNLHFTYFNINYRGQISAPSLGSAPFYTIPAFSDLFIMLPSAAQLQSFLTSRGASAADVANTLAFVNSQGGTAYVVADIRARNLGLAKVNGYDFGFDYQHEVSFGSVEASFTGTYSNYSSTAADGVNFLPNQAGLNSTRFTAVTRLGAHVGENLFGQVTWSHLGGFRLSPAAQLGQTSVSDFNLFDIFVQYDLKQKSLPPITFSVGVQNIFNTNPPLYRGALAGTLGGYANGSTIGRVFQIGAGVKF